MPPETNPYDSIVAAAAVPAPPVESDPYDSIVAAAASPRQGKRSSASYDEDSALDLIAHHESGGRNIKQQIVPAGGGYNPSVGRVTGSSTASGPWQITDSTWRKRAPQDISKKYPTAMSAPVEVQRAVAGKIFRETGFQDWAPYNAGLRKAIARGEQPPRSQSPQDPYDAIVSAANSPVGDKPTYGVAPATPDQNITETITAPPEHPQLLIPEGETPPDRFVADRTAAAGRPADEFTSDTNTVDAPLAPFNKTYTGALGQIGDMGPGAQQAYLSFVRSNAPANAPSESVDKAANNDGLAKAFLQISDFVQKNPKASDKEVNRGLAKIGADFLRDPSTKGSQLPRALHDAMLSAHYTPDEWQQIPGKLQAQIREHRAEIAVRQGKEKVVKQLQSDVQTLGATMKEWAPDLDYHLRMSPEEFSSLSKSKQIAVFRMVAERVRADQAKRDAGQPVTAPTVEEEIAMRQKIGVSRRPITPFTLGRVDTGKRPGNYKTTPTWSSDERSQVRQQVLAERSQAQRDVLAHPQGGGAARVPDTSPESIEKEVDNRLSIEKANFEWAQKNAPQIDGLTREFQNVIRNSGVTGQPAWVSETGFKGSAGLIEKLGGAIKASVYANPAIYGLNKIVNAATSGNADKLREEGADQLRMVATAMQNAAEKEGADRNVASRFTQNTIAGLVSSSPEVVAMSLGVPGWVAFGTGGGLSAAGRGEGAQGVFKETVKQGVIGAVFDWSDLIAPMKVTDTVRQTVKQLGKKAAIVGPATTGIELASGTPLKEAAIGGATNALLPVAMHGLHGRGKVEDAVGRETVPAETQAKLQEAENARSAVEIQPEGRSSDTTHQGRADGGGLELSGGEQPGLRSRGEPAESTLAEETAKAEEVPRNENVAKPERRMSPRDDAQMIKHADDVAKRFDGSVTTLPDGTYKVRMGKADVNVRTVKDVVEQVKTFANQIAAESGEPSREMTPQQLEQVLTAPLKTRPRAEELAKGEPPLTVAPKGETITTEKTDAEADVQVAAVSEPRRPARPTVAGAETEISIPDSAEKYPARYVVREAEDVEASHNHQNFNPNENYHYTNDRNYAANSEYRMRVMDRSGANFDPRQVVNTSPTLDTGPPAIDAEGNALGGNSRVMILKRVYDAGGEGAARYKEEVMRQASLLGLDPEAVAKMDKPILVRELADDKIDYQKAISNLNRPSAAPLTADEQSSSQAKQLRPEMADYIARKIEDMGEGGTVASMMDDHGADVINRMVDEGLVSAPERNTLLKDGKATPEAKKRIERLLTAAVYRDAKHMEDTPPSVQANVERIAPAMMRVAGTEWDVKPLVQTALDAIQEAKATGQTLAILEGQPSLGREPYTAEELQMAKVLQMGPRKTADRFRGYADDHANFESGQGGLFGPPPTQTQSFETHFGLSPKGEVQQAANKGGSVGARAPLNPVQPVTPPPAKPPKGATPPKPPVGPTLAEARKITRAPEPTRSVKDFVKSIPSWLQTNFTSEFTPLRDLERLVRKAAGKNAPDFDMARRFETLAGAGGIAEADLINFKKEVLAPVKHIADEFNDFLFLKRAEDRLTKDPDRKKVGTWDLAKVQKGLDELKAEVTPAEYAKLEQAGRVYQQHMQRALYLQVESGRMTPELYNKIIKENDFYAPYKLLKYLEETSSSPGTGRQIASIQDVTKAITGINEDDFGLRNLLQASADQIVRSRILAEKNMKMLALADLADVDAQSQSPTDLIKHAKLTSYYPIDYKPAEEILHQLRLQETARNPQLLEQQMVKVGKAIEFAEAAGITVKQKNLPTSLGRAIIGQIKGGRISLKAFTSEVVSHEMGHAFDEATGVIRKKVFGTMRDVTQRHSSEINSQRVFQKELKDLTQYTQLGGGKKYQSSAKERYAEFISLYIHDPMKARQLAPNWTDFFEKNILPRAKVQRVVGSLADFFQKVDALPNIKSELQGMDNHNYLELAIRRAFPEKATQLGVAFGDKPGVGNEIIPYFKDGKPKGLEVSKEVAQAVQGLNATQTSIVSKVLMAGRTPLQFGATSANLGFQVVNYLSADQLRTLITSRYGLRIGPAQTPIDMIRYPLDAVHAFYSSVMGNVFGKHNALFMDWLKSGAANSTIQRELTPESFKQTLGIEKKTTAQKVRGSGRFVLDTVAKMSNAVEEATKITTLKRGLRFEGADKMTPEQRREVIETRITPEVRNYGGSPDFARHGAQMRQLNLLMMFLNARVQGTVSDMARLTGKTGGKESAAAWGRMTTLVGLPTLLLGLVNTSPTYRKDYDKVPDWEKKNYWMIPRESFFVDEETGEPVRDYWRIPKRDIFQAYANLIENGVTFARDRSPEAAEQTGSDLIENLSPVNIEGRDASERFEAILGSVNPIFKTPIEVGLNRDTFRHRPIVPDYMKDASPEKQYRATTPAPYVKAGEAAGVSPLKLEHVARSMTGDAAGQFAVRPAEAGRESWTGFPVVRRFVRSGAVEPDSKSTEALQKSEQHQADTKIDRRRQAYEMIRQWDKAKLSPQEREAQIKTTAKTDAALADDLIRYSESRILTSTERRLRLLGIENGERAQFLVDEIERTPEDKRDAYVARLKALNIITKSVAQQMSRIRAGKVSKGKTKSIRTRLRNFSKMERQAGRYNVTAQ